MSAAENELIRTPQASPAPTLNLDMIAVSDLSMQFGGKTLFKDVSFQLNAGNRYGLVGANGSGKTTLVRILSGEVVPESGTINIPSGLNIGVLKQDLYRYEQDRIIDVVLKGRSSLWNAIEQKNHLLKQADQTTETGEKLAALEMVIADEEGYEAEPAAAEMLAGLGIPEQQHRQPLSVLSGGYRLRVLLAQCLFSRPDFLLLDEPNNHLDLTSIVWLEGYLCRFEGTSLVISHDQYFLDRISTHTMDIDYETIKIYSVPYFQFLKEKELERSQREAEIVRQEKKKAEVQAFIDRFKAKATKARQANSKAKQLDRMADIIIKRSSRVSPAFTFDMRRPSGKTVMTVRALSHSFGETEVLRDLSFSLRRGEKLAVIGPNGVGKSTLLRILIGYLMPSQGEVELGYEVQLGYCPQDHREMIPPNTTPYEWLYGFGSGETVGRIRGLLGRVLIQGDDAHKSTAALSGGESARLIFARIMLEQPNLLVLDEPTNHMDIESLEALADGLSGYDGTIVCVSHDRRFIERFSTSVLELKADGFNHFPGGYREYVEKSGVDYLDRVQVRLDSLSGSRKPDRARSQKEHRELNKAVSRVRHQVDKIETEIAGLEDGLARVEERLADGSLYQPGGDMALKELLEEKDRLQKRLEERLREWEDRQVQLDEVTSALAKAVR